MKKLVLYLERRAAERIDRCKRESVSGRETAKWETERTRARAKEKEGETASERDREREAERTR